MVGTPDAEWGAVVTAFVVCAEPALSEREVDRFCRESDSLASFKRPRRIVFVDALPRGPSGKVLARVVDRYG